MTSRKTIEKSDRVLRCSQQSAENEDVTTGLEISEETLDKRIDDRINQRLDDIFERYENKFKVRWDKYEAEVLSKCGVMIDKKVADSASKINEKIDTLSKSVQWCETAIEKNTTGINDLSENLENGTAGVSADSVESLRVELTELKEKCTSLESALAEHKRHATESHKALTLEMENVERHGRKLNLVFEGVEHSEREDCKRKIEAILRHDMQINNLRNPIDIAHRQYMSKDETKVIPIVARFRSVEDKIRVLENSKSQALRDKGIKVRPDNPPRYVERRRYMFKFLSSAKSTDPSARVVGDKLKYNGRFYTADNIHTAQIAAAEHTTTTDSQVRFYGQLSPFSNFYRAGFSLLGVDYNCVEQALMYNRAMNANDRRMAFLIKRETNPATMKRLGNRYRPTSDAAKKQEHEFLADAVYQKFAENNDLKQELLNTGEKLLLECNPYDLEYSTGLAADNPMLDNLEFTGKNVLGKILRDVRNKLHQN